MTQNEPVTSGEGCPQLSHLERLKLWHVENYKPILITAKQQICLTHLFMWNLVITDPDMDRVVLPAVRRTLKDVRIGGDEIGYVRLSEESVKRLIRECPRLSKIGGVVEWKGEALFFSTLEVWMTQTSASNNVHSG